MSDELVAERLMRPLCVIVLDVLLNNLPEANQAGPGHDLDGEEIHGGDGAPVRAQEVAPRRAFAALGRRLHAGLEQYALDGVAADVMADVEQRAADFSSSPTTGSLWPCAAQARRCRVFDAGDDYRDWCSRRISSQRAGDTSASTCRERRCSGID